MKMGVIRDPGVRYLQVWLGQSGPETCSYQKHLALSGLAVGLSYEKRPWRHSISLMACYFTPNT